MKRYPANNVVFRHSDAGLRAAGRDLKEYRVPDVYRQAYNANHAIPVSNAVDLKVVDPAYFPEEDKAYTDGLLTALCTRFWETWPTLTELEQISVVSALSPVVTEIMHIGLSGVLGCLALLTFALWRRSLAMAFFAAMTGSAVWAGATALLLPTQAAVEAVCMAGAGAAFGCGIWIICLLVKRLCGQGKFI